jgi:molybdopterin-guanine dinucleotide biosynthesis protein A
MPGVGRAQLEWLARQLNHTESIGVMCRRLLAKESIVEPFPLMLRRAALDVVRARLQSGRLSVIGLLEEPGFSAANTPPEWGERVWVNLNRPVDLQHFSEKTDGGW